MIDTTGVYKRTQPCLLLMALIHSMNCNLTHCEYSPKHIKAAHEHPGSMQDGCRAA